MSEQRVISTAVAPIHREPSFSSEMTTQALLWEKVEVLDQEKFWFHIRQKDGYTGWIYTFYLLENSDTFDNWVTINDRFAPFTSNGKNQNQRILSFGTRIPVQDGNVGYLKTTLPGRETGSIPEQKKNGGKTRRQIESFAKLLLGTPYLWGGRSAFGFDCSGFVQLVLATTGISIARDTRQQVETPWLYEIDIAESKPGDLVFFAENEKINHVGFSLGGGKIIHCSGEVKIESINDGDEGFSEILHQLLDKTFSISEQVTD